MKKFRILAFVVMLMLAVAVFAGCAKVKVDDVKEDPAKYLSEASELTFSDSALVSAAPEGNEKTTVDITLSGEENSVNASMFVDAAAKKGSFSTDALSMIMASEDAPKIAAYYEDGQIVLECALLEDYIGTSAVGLDTSFTLEELQASGLYQTYAPMLGINDSQLEMFETILGDDGISGIVTSLTEDLAVNPEDQFEYGEVTEETITVGEKEIKTIVVTVEYSDSSFDAIIENIVSAAKQFATLAGQEIGDEELDDAIDQMKAYMPEISGEIKYYIVAKTGALIKSTGEYSMKVTDQYDDTTELDMEYDIVYGENPEEELLPVFTAAMEADGAKISVEGESTREDGVFTMNAKVTADVDDEEQEIDVVYEIDEDGKYELTLSGENYDGEEQEYTLTGEYVCSENETKFSVDVSGLYDEEDLEYAIVAFTKIEIAVKYGEDGPALPEYKDLLDFTAEEIAEIVGQLGGGSYDDDYYDDDYFDDDDFGDDDFGDDYYGDIDYEAAFRNELMDYYECSDDELDEVLSQYGEYDYSNQEDYLYALYVNYNMSLLMEDYGIAYEDIEAYVGEQLSDDASYFDIAVLFYEDFFEMAYLGSEDEF